MMSDRSAVAIPDPVTRLGIQTQALEAFCTHWKITELAFFGSVLGPRFRTESDVDVLVTFAPGAGHSLFDLITAQEELEALLGRSVHLVERRALRNPFVRREVLRTHRVAYAA